MTAASKSGTDAPFMYVSCTRSENGSNAARTLSSYPSEVGACATTNTRRTDGCRLSASFSVSAHAASLNTPVIPGGVLPIVTPGSVFTLANAGQIPNILVHFHHQVQKLEVEVLNSAGQKVHPVFSNGIEGEFLPRNGTATGLFAVARDGNRSHDQGGGNGDHRRLVADGTYTLTLKALKALGDPANPAHWETFTTPSFVIDRP